MGEKLTIKAGGFGISDQFMYIATTGHMAIDIENITHMIRDCISFVVLSIGITI